MNPSAPFIHRPVATSLLMAAILIVGALGFRFLPLSALPEVDYPTIQVTTSYPGASAEVMSATVTAPLEGELGEMSGLLRMSSVSGAGASVITLQFGLDEELDNAEQEVQAAINGATSLLPTDLPAPPVYAKVNPADAPVLTLAVTSDVLPLTEVRNLVDTRLAQKISQVSGVGQVSLAGGQKPAMRVQADTRALASFGLTLDDVLSTIDAANANGAKGTLNGAEKTFAINANDQLLTVEDYRRLIVTFAGGAAVRLEDVATVVEGAENVQLGAWADRTPAILLDVRRQPGANVIDTVDRIRAQLPDLEASLPGALELRVLADRTGGIRAAVHDVEMELVLAVVLVVLVIYVFLHDARATLIASIAVPVSIVGSFAVMYLAGFSLNNLSLMALTIATGFVVDDAIVMIENIERHREMGQPPFAAAVKGAKEIGFTIISLTISLVAVLIPLLFMGDVVGRLFREFAVTLAITILISAVVSLTIVPMLAARWLRHGDAHDAEPRRPSLAQRFGARTQAFFDRVVARYDRGLGWVLAHQTLTLAATLGTIVLTLAMYAWIPKGLFPTQDTGQLRGVVQAEQGVSYARMARLQGALVDALLADPDVASIASSVGVDAAGSALLSAGGLTINLAADRGDLDDVQARLRERAEDVAGVELFLQPVQDLAIDAETGPTQYRVSVEGADSQEVDAWTRALAARLGEVGSLRNVTTRAGNEGPAVYVDIDRDTAARLGITALAIDEALYSAFGQRIVSTIFTQTNQYRVILEASPDLTGSRQALDTLQLRTGSGASTPLSAVATVREHRAPLQVTRVAQFPAATLGFDVAPGVALGDAVADIRAAAADIDFPAGLGLTFLGAASAFESSLGSTAWLIVGALVCVYIVLGVLYESFVHPLTILSTLPSAGIGALAALMLGGNELGVIGIIGIILLIGIVKKNAIMMIDFALDAERVQGMAPRDAIHQAALLRFRPILMTTFAALFAAVPLMLGTGEGAELRRPLGISIFGGLIVSQLLTLFTTPVVYLWFDRLGARWRRRLPRPGEADTLRGDAQA
ncbi:efflux RND transporter permease subunit [Coralloluteibacterium stylophorae]|uniref:Efflux RND transporter permease subunit n=1 Tax=Coralloluteibacterium stylophorae TaxID=1776034 RepID=A0A8J8AXE6_9GAMM|nr:efflux RND transporter permease subunit [Coralloluteibacterium stylophorae]MBS7458490.1 efflux RND transporter permease subunit [Coralloluteibacterium stylophorae]